MSGAYHTPDLCIIIGTALAVSPFNFIPRVIKKDIPKILFNMDNTTDTGGMDFDDPKNNKLFV